MKIGLDQLHRPAPRWYSRLVNALILFVVPATGTAVASLPPEMLSDKWKILVGIAVSYVVALLKAFQYLIGNESSSNGTTEH
jgi:putative effector of murein hydrolase LrgA (UPF0299 family)